MKSVFIYVMILAACFFLKCRKQGALMGRELCGNHREDMVNIRFENISAYDFSKVKVYNGGKEIELNGLGSGERSCFESFTQIGDRPDIELEIKGITYRMGPSVFRINMEKGLEKGYYNCSINVADGGAHDFTLEFNRL